VSPARRTPDATTALRTSLIEHAGRLVRREGVKALTMRGLAAEAGCALGLPYKVFANRDELVATLVDEQFRRLSDVLDDLVAAAGTGTVAENLGRFAEAILGSESQVIHLAGDIKDPTLTQRSDEFPHGTRFVNTLPTALTRYVAAEKQAGRIDPGIDERTIGFLVTGALHNLLVSGEAYPRPTLPEIEAMMRDLARLLETRTEG
jgi:AcrR family transcriptional regulator